MSCAALGTSVTADHVKKLLRLVDKIYFSFDGDSAGQHALRRAMEAALPAVADDQEVRFVVLPPEHDPDSLIKERGPDAFEAELEKSLTLTQFFVKSVSVGKDLSTAEGRSQFLAEAKPLIVAMHNAPLLRTQLVGELAMHARMSPDELERAFGIVRPMPQGRTLQQMRDTRWGRFDSRRGLRGRPQRVAPAAVGDMRERLLQNMLSYPQLASEFSSRIEEEFLGAEDMLSREIVEVWRAVTAGEEPIAQTQFALERLIASESFAHYSDLVGREMELQTPLETARAETELAFDRLEMKKLEATLAEEVQNPRPDLELIRALNQKRVALKQRIDEEQRRHIDRQTE